MATLLLVIAVLTVALTTYALGHYLCVAVFLLARKRTRTFDAYPELSVAVLVPARNEGDRALRVIRSLLDQDHAGPVEIHLLLKDASDTALPELARLYPDARFDGVAGQSVELVDLPNRRALVTFTGHDPKSDKINAVAPRMSTDYVAILDCDHQAYPDWIRSSLSLLKETGARMVQGRRDPISARGFFSLWDSLHQHVGCELFNGAFTALDLTVFFTGTTAVLDTALLRDNPFSECITEDIDFSYRVSFQGVKVIANPHSGSAEETSPDLYSFLARRRRWSNGHTSTFFRHLVARRSAPASLLARTQFLYHGSHYLLSVGVFVLHLLIGLVFVRTFSATSQVAGVLSSLLLAFMVGRTQRTLGLLPRIGEVAVLFGWLFPAVVIAMNVVQALLLDDFSRAALPISDGLQGLGLVGLLAPLIVLLTGLLGFRQLGLGTFFVVVLTYPLAFYLDISGVLLGMGDYLSGGARWRLVSRASLAAASKPGPRASLVPTASIRESWRLSAVLSYLPHSLAKISRQAMKPSRWVPLAAMVALFCAGAFFAPSTRIEVAARRCEALAHDGEPWIVPAKRIRGYCGPGAEQELQPGSRTGTFHSVRDDDLRQIDPQFWDRLDKTFPCNLAAFSPGSVHPRAAGGMDIALTRQTVGDRSYVSGDIATKDEPDARFTYGRFEVVMKPPKNSGVITAFFLYRFDPWQEIDAEFLGKDPTKILLNVYYNPGEEGDLYNYGLLGTPVLVDLGFDASEDFHTYAIEWEASEIRWFADGQLIHVRKAGAPTPIPHLPMRLHANLWPCCSEQLAGPFEPGSQPIIAAFKSISVARWYPSPLPEFLSRFDLRVTSGDPADWRQGAKWMQPDRGAD